MKHSEQLLTVLKDMFSGFPALDLSQRSVFLKNLIFMHAVMVASESLLRLAGEKADGELRAYYKRHLEEERAHDEWLSEDLAAHGVDVSALPISPEAVAMAGSQYYLIHHVDPCALLGYMAVLECFPAPIDAVEAAEKRHGKEVCRTLRYHATHDVDHGKEMLAMIDRLPANQFRLVLENAVQTVLYIGAAASKFSH